MYCEFKFNFIAKKMKSDGIAVTAMDPIKTGIPCSYVIHLNAEETKTDWKTKIRMALNMAEDSTVKSLAFPAIGTAGTDFCAFYFYIQIYHHFN